MSPRLQAQNWLWTEEFEQLAGLPGRHLGQVILVSVACFALCEIKVMLALPGRPFRKFEPEEMFDKSQ